MHYNLFCHNVIQQQAQAECTMHGLYCYKQHDNHTNLWIKIILSTGVMVIYLFGMKFIPFWYEIHTVFGMLSVKSEIIPILV